VLGVSAVEVGCLGQDQLVGAALADRAMCDGELEVVDAAVDVLSAGLGEGPGGCLRGGVGKEAGEGGAVVAAAPRLDIGDRPVIRGALWLLKRGDQGLTAMPRQLVGTDLLPLVG